VTDGPENYSRNLDVCPDQLRAAFLASEKWLKKIRQLRNRGEFTDQHVEQARLAFEVYRRQVASYEPEKQ
jgi:hypothetical protein